MPVETDLPAGSVKTRRIAFAQINPVVGDIAGNTGRVLAAIANAQQQGAHLLLLPELVLTGYPPEDLLLRPSLAVRIEQALQQVREACGDLYVVLGYPARQADGTLFNAAGVFRRGECLLEYHKQCLPNYRVFDEKRYFSAGDRPGVFDFDGLPTALTICEDIWHAGPMAQAREAGARLMLSLNASPFHVGKQQQREALLAQRAREGGMPLLYLNQVGGQDELVFDGGSCAVQADGSLCWRAPAFEELVHTVAVVQAVEVVQPATAASAVRVQSAEAGCALPEELASVYNALVCAVRDYVNKNRFASVVLGLSGGIDSALTLAIAVDALGAERVEAVMMPYRYTAEMSQEDAAAEAAALGVSYRVIPIEAPFAAFMETLAGHLPAGAQTGVVDVTEQNLQARCRGVLLMALSNRKGALVLTTGNKSEVAVGYCTLYGDMAGGFDVLKDVPKTLVYRLCEYRNALAPVIPQRVIDRPPSAELAPGQKDQDSLPPYDVLDAILARYIEADESAEQIIAAGFAEADVQRVVRLVDLNEYKRRQAAVGPRISERGFGRDRRYPITNGWKPGI